MADKPSKGTSTGGRKKSPPKAHTSPTTPQIVEKALNNIKPGEKIDITQIDKYGNRWEISKERKEPSMFRKHFAALAGTAFLLLAVVLVFAYPEPTTLQARVILAVLSLGGGAFASELSGMIRANLSFGDRLKIAATGTFAVFIILYFIDPLATP